MGEMVYSAAECGRVWCSTRIVHLDANGPLPGGGSSAEGPRLRCLSSPVCLAYEKEHMTPWPLIRWPLLKKEGTAGHDFCFSTFRRVGIEV